ncbi:MAG: AMP phosphorylase [Candidatus Asgardarchaeia archaeon]
MAFEFTVKILDITSKSRSIIMNKDDAKKLRMNINDRVKVITKSGKETVCLLDITSTFISPGEIGVFYNISEDLEIKNGDRVIIELAPSPASIRFIKKKMDGRNLSKEEFKIIVSDIVNGTLSDLEILAFVLSQKFLGMDMDEIEFLTRAMAETGDILKFDEPVYDKHSIGGVPGNKVSLLIVPIVAAAGLLIPKTSSRAITSPSGTADTMEVLAPVEFDAEELKRLAIKTRGVIVWGGALNLAPADDIIIRVEHPLSIDPKPQMMASIMSKKIAVGVNFLVLDIPVGKGAKIENINDGRKFARQMVELGERVNIKVECGITYADQPVGHAVGPALEAKEALEALLGKGPTSLIEKSTALAGILLEMAGKATRGAGQDLAKKILYSGKAHKKMLEIIEAQGGDPKITPEKIPLAANSITIESPADGYVTRVSNSSINQIARIAGAPFDKTAGLILHRKVGYKVKKGDPLLTIYTENESKLTTAHSYAMANPPVTVEGMLLQRISENV